MVNRVSATLDRFPSGPHVGHAGRRFAAAYALTETFRVIRSPLRFNTEGMQIGRRANVTTSVVFWAIAFWVLTSFYNAATLPSGNIVSELTNFFFPSGDNFALIHGASDYGLVKASVNFHRRFCRHKTLNNPSFR